MEDIELERLEQPHETGEGEVSGVGPESRVEHHDDWSINHAPDDNTSTDSAEQCQCTEDYETGQDPPPPCFDQAYALILKVKSRFWNNHKAYNRYLDILGGQNLRSQEVVTQEEWDECLFETYRRVSRVLKGHNDLIREFCKFLPPHVQRQVLPTLRRSPAETVSAAPCGRRRAYHVKTRSTMDDAPSVGTRSRSRRGNGTANMGDRRNPATGSPGTARGVSKRSRSSRQRGSQRRNADNGNTPARDDKAELTAGAATIGEVAGAQGGDRRLSEGQQHNSDISQLAVGIRDMHVVTEDV